MTKDKRKDADRAEYLKAMVNGGESKSVN